MMTKLFLEVQRMREHFGWDKTDTLDFLVDALKEEVTELEASLSINDAAIQSELADVLMYAFAICIDQGYDVEDVVMKKLNEVMRREY